MQLSTNTIHFSQNKLKNIISFTNSTHSRAIYKVKANNTEAFSIYPSRGFIGPKQTLEMRISMWKYIDIKGKLLFIYAEVRESAQTNFDKVWCSIQKQAFINQIIEIICTPIQQNEKIQQKQFKTTESPIYEQQLEGSNNCMSLQSNQSNLERKQLMQSVVIHKTTTINMSKTLKDTKRSKQAEQNQMQAYSNLNKSKAWDNELRKQREQNKHLKEKLIQKEKKLRYYEQLVQKDINNSVKHQKQQQFKLNNLNLCLLVLVCIFFGFFVAKINLKDSDI